MGSLGAMLAVDLAAQVHAAEPPKAEPVSDRKIRLGIVRYGVCRMGAAFGFHVEVVAVSDLIPESPNAAPT